MGRILDIEWIDHQQRRKLITSNRTSNNQQQMIQIPSNNLGGLKMVGCGWSNIQQTYWSHKLGYLSQNAYDWMERINCRELLGYWAVFKCL